jgi:hypothetical protein
MGLVSGLIDKETLIAWADKEIMCQTVPLPEIMELSLSVNRPVSEILWLLNSFEGDADYDVPLKLLFARAGVLLAQDAQRAPEIVRGLRLLTEEQYFDKTLSVRLNDLDRWRERSDQGDVSGDELLERLSRFLADYVVYADDARQFERGELERGML